jgi:eukaryotic-like serine/threonine-protein kinase
MSDIPERLAAALSGRYVLERQVGAGGMATVYLARDLRHKRLVALKVVRPELGGREGVERFLREIELAARLQHPHILPVFDSGVIDDGGGTPIPYFVMPYVEGETLRQLLQREGRLPVDAALTLAGEVADALAYAHAKGVVHRDIKPENILLSDGHAVVADFGVAKALEQGTAVSPSAGSTRLTWAGMAMGTPQYMSPEQATGDAAVDARADQYSLACVLYEMLAGEPPFAGITAQAVIAKSLTAPRPHVGRVRAGIPPPLDAAVVKGLAVEPAGRYPDMASMRSALRAAGATTSPGMRRRVLLAGGMAALVAGAGVWLSTRPPRPIVAPAAEMLAVLPFHTSGPGVEFLGEGMVDLLATNLRGVGGIKTVDPRAVLQRWSGARRGDSDDLTRALAVGRDLDAYSVVLGSAVSTGGRVRLAADLHTVDGERLGRAQVDGPTDSVLTLVDRLSVALLRDVWRSREPLPNLSIASLTTDSLAALRAYLQGERYYRRLDFDSALSAYSRAVEVDSTFALAHLRRALVFGWTSGYGNPESYQAAVAGLRFAERLPPRSRRLLNGYRLFNEGSPLAIDSMSAFVAEYPDDLEGWYTYGEALYHLRDLVPNEPDTIMAAFDSVIAGDSALTPAVIHPLELTLMYRDSARFQRYLRLFERTASAPHLAAHRVAARMVWGPPPSDSAMRTALRTVPYPLINAVLSAYRDEASTSDTVLARMERLQKNMANPTARRFAPIARGFALVGLGRLREAQSMVDTVAKISPGAAAGLLGWPIALGIAPRSSGGSRLDSLIALDVGKSDSPRKGAYPQAVRMLANGNPKEARRIVAQGMALRDETADSVRNRGMLRATGGWARLVEGDTIGGIQDLRDGLVEASGPGSGDRTGFLRFQLALVLAARPETRSDGIRRLRYGFDNAAVSFIPLSYLALGRTYQAAGQRDSAAIAYGRFIRLWDKADPELQGRVREAREALQEITRERPNSP